MTVSDTNMNKAENLKLNDLMNKWHFGDKNYHYDVVKEFIESLIKKEKLKLIEEVQEVTSDAIALLNTDEDGYEIVDSVQDAFTRQNITQNVIYHLDELKKKID